MNFIIGSNGLIGLALTQTFQSKLVNRAVYQDWYKESCGDEILNYFKRNGLTKNSIIFIASGITDNNEGNNLIDVNFMLPRNIFLAIKNEPVTVITFGSILEILMPDFNSYSKSKKMLSDFIECLEVSICSYLHIRLHTLYGSKKIHQHMFLGQMLDAINSNNIFRMTAGTQYREYHHIDDVMIAIDWLIKNGHSGIINLNNGKPIQLIHLAELIFSSCDKDNLLFINEKQVISDEIYTKQTPHVAYKNIPARNYIDDITNYILGKLIA